jgi:hypothetical protein
LPRGRRGRPPRSNEPIFASNGEVWRRRWTSTCKVVLLYKPFSRASQTCGAIFRRSSETHDKPVKKVTLLDKQKRFLSCNSSKGCPKGVTPLPGTGAAHVGRQDVGLCARDCGVSSRSVVGRSPAWRRTRATILREKMVSKSRWNRFRDAVVPPPTRRGPPRV